MVPSMSADDVVVNDNFDDTLPQRFFRLAIGYAGSSRYLFRAIIDGSLPPTFDQCQAAHFLFDHALELFFKGAIYEKTGKLEPTHELEQLYNRYRKLYPKKAFAMSGRIAETVKNDPNSPFSEFARYPVDSNGNLWRGQNSYTAVTWENEVACLCADLSRLIPLISPLPA